ncbi:MAG: hypothetical protein H7259_10380 [Cytophagales bacterium]|nr:hypothetical protein [Cytophaga sp.]
MVYKKYIVPGVFLKVSGGVFVCLIYNYYYGGGDTTTYFACSNAIANIIINEPLAGFEILFSPAGNFPREYHQLMSQFPYVSSEETYMIIRLATILQLFAFNSFLLTSALFGYLSFWALFQLYILFVKIYPELYKPLAYTILFIPSVLAWGSGIFKDTVTLSSLCLFVVAFYTILIEKRISISHFLIAGIAIFLLLLIKVYILIAIVPPLLFLKLKDVQQHIKSKALLFFSTPILICVIASLALYAVQGLGNLSHRQLYSVENILEKSKVQREYLYGISKQTNGSGYTLGQFDNTLGGLIAGFPAAVNATFFRPYLWESNNVIMFMSALESFAFLLITIYCLTKYGFLRSFKIIQNEHFVFFCLIFALTFGFFVGISTYNFGSLVRYKIPALPFFLSAMIIIYYKKKVLFQKTEIAT